MLIGSRLPPHAAREVSDTIWAMSRRPLEADDANIFRPERDREAYIVHAVHIMSDLTGPKHALALQVASWRDPNNVMPSASSETLLRHSLAMSFTQMNGPHPAWQSKSCQ